MAVMPRTPINPNVMRGSWFSGTGTDAGFAGCTATVSGAAACADDDDAETPAAEPVRLDDIELQEEDEEEACEVLDAADEDDVPGHWQSLP